MVETPAKKSAAQQPQCKCPHNAELQKAPTEKLFDEIVKVEVGSSQKVYSLHRGRLCHHSSYFSGALTSGFREAEEKVVKLPTEEEKVFDAVYRWLYRGRLLETELASGDQDKLRTTLQMDGLWSLVANLYIFADARGMPALSNAVIDLLHQMMVAANIYPCAQVDKLYTDTPEKSPMRRYLVDTWINIPGDGYSENIAKLLVPINNVEFLKDVVKASIGKPEDRVAWSKLNTCQYHDQALPAQPGTQSSTT